MAKQRQIIYEIDKLKSITRRNYLQDESRLENTAEHTWHSIMMALIFAEYSKPEVDLFHVLKLIAVHDIVEIYAGDTFFYDEEANKGKYERETVALDKISDLLPSDQKSEVKDLWLEFETQTSVHAEFANAIDQLMPVLLNVSNSGKR